MDYLRNYINFAGFTWEQMPISITVAPGHPGQILPSPGKSFGSNWNMLDLSSKDLTSQALQPCWSHKIFCQNSGTQVWLNTEGCSFKMRIRASLVLEFKSRFKTTGEHLQYSTHSGTSAGFPAGSRKHFFERSTPSAMLHDHQSDKSRPEHPKIDQPTWPMVIFYHPDPSFNCFNHAKNMTQCAPQSGAWSSA